MDSKKPLNQLTLVATSITEDLGFIALADLAEVFAKAKGEARLIGGQMVTLHVQRWGLGQELYACVLATWRQPRSPGWPRPFGVTLSS